MSKTVLIILSTVLVLGLTLLVTNILSRRKKTDLADWEVGGRDLPYYVVIGTQFATAMGGGVLVGHVGNAYNFGLSMLRSFLLCRSLLLCQLQNLLSAHRRDLIHGISGRMDLLHH